LQYIISNYRNLRCAQLRYILLIITYTHTRARARVRAHVRTHRVLFLDYIFFH